MNLRFSQRRGEKPIKNVIQTDDMDNDLRIGIWNVLDKYYWQRGSSFYSLNDYKNGLILDLLKKLWADYFKWPIDIIGDDWDKCRHTIKVYFLGCAWYEVYDFIEFVVNNYKLVTINEKFCEECNIVLEREVSGYRFIGKKISQISSKEEISEIEQAISSKGQLVPVSIHLSEALEKMSDRKTPDYRNSIKESISAVEAVVKLITKNKKATLPVALDILTNRKIEVHGALIDAFKKLYGYTSDANGIRHALMEESNLGFEDAKYMLVSCSAFVNYLKVKASKAGIILE
jgi:hypothetical protein